MHSVLNLYINKSNSLHFTYYLILSDKVVILNNNYSILLNDIELHRMILYISIMQKFSIHSGLRNLI